MAQKATKIVANLTWGVAKSIMTMSVDKGMLEAGFSAAEESIDFTAAQLTAGLLRDGLPRIVATFVGAAAAALRPARVNTARSREW